MNEVDQAAKALLDPSTDPTTRTLASQFLEGWMATESAWQRIVEWLHRCQTQADGAVTPGSDESIRYSMQLLCLQLLQSKIRREVPPRSEPPSTLPVRILVTTLSQLLRMESNPSVLSSACITLTAMSVRCGQASDLFHTCSCSLASAFSNRGSTPLADAPFPPLVALKLLSNIPQELSACALTTPQVTGSLSPHVSALLGILRQALVSSATMKYVSDVSKPWELIAAALEALYNWTKIGHLSISTWNAPISAEAHAAEPPMLPVVAQLLSTAPTNEAVIVMACQALTEALLVPTDACTDARSIACQVLWQSPGFVAVPLQVASCPRNFTVSPLRGNANGDDDDDCWEDACHALATLVATLVCEQVDDLVGEEEDATTSLVQDLLLTLQQHSLLKVRIIVLEVWLTLQDVPTAQRHVSWKKPLFSRLLTILLQTLSYPPDYPHFANTTISGAPSTRATSSIAWNESTTDESEWNEYRRLAKDVLVSIYFLLRSDYVEYCVHCLSQTDQGWRIHEAALYALSSSAREVCARIKSGTASGTYVVSGNGQPKSLLAADRERTGQALLHLVQFLCGPTPEALASSMAQRHLHVLAGFLDFLEAYAPAWGALPCTPEVCLQLLAVLNQCLEIPSLEVPASKSIRSLLIGCSSKLLAVDSPQLLNLLRQLMDSSATLPDFEVFGTVLEGCTRLLLQVNNKHYVHEGLVLLAEPLLQSGRSAIQNVKMLSASDHRPEAWVMAAADSLVRSLDGLQAIVRFCDFADQTRDTAAQLEFLWAVWSFLEDVSQSAAVLVVGKDGGADTQRSLLGLYERVLTAAPWLNEAHSQRVLELAAVLLERSTPQPCALAFLARLTEVVGSGDAFVDALQRASAAVWSHLSQQPSSSLSESGDLLAALLELHRRCLLNCPATLVKGPQFPVAVAGAVESLAAFGGEREATRAALRFLAQLYGWRQLPHALEPHLAHTVDDALRHWGGAVIRHCLRLMVGGPPMLAPVCADCTFAVLSSTVATSSVTTAAPNVVVDAAPPYATTVGARWLEAAMPTDVDPTIFGRVGSLLLQMAAAGPIAPQQQRARARALLDDWCQIHRGEMPADEALEAYTLPA